jgi:tetratricopeptide (TPR) repeat protein
MRRRSKHSTTETLAAGAMAMLIVMMTGGGIACRGGAGGMRVAVTPKTISSSGLSSIESADPSLREALARLALLPSAPHHRAVAAAYLRLRIRDKAYDHLTSAVFLDPRDAAAYDALARMWRDWGFPHQGLNDAQRAVKYAPTSPIVHNTLGTVFEAMGLRHQARQSYWRAVELDGRAEYALANLTRVLTVQWSEARDANAATPSVTKEAPLDAPRKDTPRKESSLP